MKVPGSSLLIKLVVFDVLYMCLRTIYPLKKANILFIILFTLFICFAKHFSSRSQDVRGRRDPREVQSPHSTDKKLHGP